MIPIRRHRGILAAVLLILVASGVALLFRQGTPAADWTAMLPPGEGPVLAIHVGKLRRAGILDQLLGSPAAEEPDYKAFVEATGFDYRRDLDEAAVAFLPTGNFFVLQGRFARDRLTRYAEINGGRCIKGVCTMVGSSRDRQISFEIRDSRILALAVTANDPFAVTAIRAGNRPSYPARGVAYFALPRSSLRPRLGLPPAVNATLTVLQPASETVVALDGGREGMYLSLDAQCTDGAVAQSIATSLKGGEFRVEGATVRGRWLLPADWLRALASAR